MRRRRIRFAAGLALLLGLCLWSVSAQAQVPALQFCGQTQFTDFVVLGGMILDGPRTIVQGQWIQTIPHFYTIMGSITIIRDPDNVVTFLGLDTVAATGEPFPTVPSCTVKLTLNPAGPSIFPQLVGQAIVTCPVNDVPVVSTLNLTLTPCTQAPFPNGQVTSQIREIIPVKPTVSPDEIDYSRKPAFQ